MPRWSIPFLVFLVLAACGLGRTDVPVATPPTPIVAEIEPLTPVGWPGDRLPEVPDRLDLTDLPIAFSAPPLAAPAGLAEETPAVADDGGDAATASPEIDGSAGDAPSVDDG